jgi:hypothetical protein
MTLFVMSSVGSSTRGLGSSLEIALPVEIENLISTSIGSHNGDDATKDFPYIYESFGNTSQVLCFVTMK